MEVQEARAGLVGLEDPGTEHREIAVTKGNADRLNRGFNVFFKTSHNL